MVIRPDSTSPGADDGRLLDSLLRVHGREAERRTLLGCLERACAWEPQLVLVRGESGIGKTALIHETFEPVIRHEVLFLSGKFEQFDGSQPYGAWLQLTAGLVSRLLAEPADVRARLRARFGEVLEARAAALCAVMPTLRELLGDTGDPGPLPPAEARHRFHRSFVDLLRVVGEQERPLLLFLDDLQWIDGASLALLEALLQMPDGLPLILVLSIRDEEVSRAHPLMLALSALRGRTRFAPTELALRPLAVPEIAAMLADAMSCPPEALTALAESLAGKSGGNPLFVRQFLGQSREQGWLAFDPLRGQWTWDLPAIQAASHPAHVLDLLGQRLRRLPVPTRSLLASAACMGGRFEPAVLARLSAPEVLSLRARLQPAIDQEFVVRADDGSLRFAHDRMQEAALVELSSNELSDLHRRIARCLIAVTDDAAAAGAPAEPARAIEIARHLAQAGEGLRSPAARLELARWCLAAARQAKAATAFASALDHLRDGMAHAPDALWEADPALAHELFRERGELEYLNSHFDAAERFVRLAIERTPDRFAKADLHHMLVTQYTLQSQYPRAIEAAIEGLALFGVQLPESDFETVRDARLAEVAARVGSGSLGELAGLPPMTAPEPRAVMRLLAALGPPCYRSHPRLWAVVVAMQMRLCLEHGSDGFACYTFPAFGGLLMHVGAGHDGDCAALCRVTEAQIARFPDPALRSIGHLMMGSSLRHWFAPLETASQDYLEAYRSGRASGNLQYAAYGFAHNTYCRFFMGAPLGDLIPEALGYLEYSRERGNRWSIDLIGGALRVFETLHGDGTDARWPGRDETEASYLARCTANGNVQVDCIYRIMQACARLLRGEFEAAAACVREAEARLDSVSVQGLLPAAQFPALKALALALAPQAFDLTASEVGQAFDEGVTRYAKWSLQAPQNHAHWHQLLVGEQARHRGELRRFVHACDRALQLARANGSWLAVALIAQRARVFWDQEGHAGFAAHYRKALRRALRRGGAAAALACDDRRAQARDDEEEPDASGVASGLQVAALIGLSDALAAHTNEDELLIEIVGLALRHSGASRAAVAIVRQGMLRLGAQATPAGPTVPRGMPAVDSVDGLPAVLLRHVADSGRALQFRHQEIGATPLLSQDPELQRMLGGGDGFRGTVRITPGRCAGRVMTVVYLEFAAPAEPPDEARAALIDFLVAQAAMALRNLELIASVAGQAEARRTAEAKASSADAEIAIRRGVEERLKQLAETDALTQLPNRRLFFNRLERGWSALRAGHGASITLMMVDIDHFKAVNDRFGHDVGDRVLCHVAGLLCSVLRSRDLPARLGGEEFAAMLHGVTPAQALEIAERLRRAVRDSPTRHGDREVGCTVSIGLAPMAVDDPDREAGLRRADAALYRAKDGGRDRVCLDEPLPESER